MPNSALAALCRRSDYADLGPVGAGQPGRAGQSGRHNPGTVRLFLPGAGGGGMPDRAPQRAHDRSTVDSVHPDLPAPLRRPSRNSTEAGCRKPTGAWPLPVIRPAPGLPRSTGDYADISGPGSARDHPRDAGPRLPRRHRRDSPKRPGSGLIPLTLGEIRRLLAHLTTTQHAHHAHDAPRRGMGLVDLASTPPAPRPDEPLPKANRHPITIWGWSIRRLRNSDRQDVVYAAARMPRCWKSVCMSMRIFS